MAQGFLMDTNVIIDVLDNALPVNGLRLWQSCYRLFLKLQKWIYSVA